MAADLRSFEDGRLQLEAVDFFLVTLELVQRELVATEQMNGFDEDVDEASECVRESLTFLRGFHNVPAPACESAGPPVLHRGCVGSPKFEIPYQQMTFLIESRFTAPQMAEIFEVSLRTVRRRMASYGLSVTAAQYAVLSDEEVDDLIREIQHNFLTCGNRQMQGQLLSRGLRVKLSEG